MQDDDDPQNKAILDAFAAVINFKGTTKTAKGNSDKEGSPISCAHAAIFRHKKEITNNEKKVTKEMNGMDDEGSQRYIALGSTIYPIPENCTFDQSCDISLEDSLHSTASEEQKGSCKPVPDVIISNGKIG